MADKKRFNVAYLENALSDSNNKLAKNLNELTKGLDVSINTRLLAENAFEKCKSRGKIFLFIGPHSRDVINDSIGDDIRNALLDLRKGHTSSDADNEILLQKQNKQITAARALSRLGDPRNFYGDQLKKIERGYRVKIDVKKLAKRTAEHINSLNLKISKNSDASLQEDATAEKVKDEQFEESLVFVLSKATSLESRKDPKFDIFQKAEKVGSKAYKSEQTRRHRATRYAVTQNEEFADLIKAKKQGEMSNNEYHTVDRMLDIAAAHQTFEEAKKDSHFKTIKYKTLKDTHDEKELEELFNKAKEFSVKNIYIRHRKTSGICSNCARMCSFLYGDPGLGSTCFRNLG